MTGQVEKKTTKNSFVQTLKAAASLKVTVVCIAILVLLVIWGTVYQAEHGLYQAQQKFFHSWMFFIFGFIPFPGTVMVMFVLFINLLLSLYFRIGFRWSNLGNIITHTGIIVLLLGGFYTSYFSQESTLTMREGQSESMSSSNHLWELAIWKQSGKTRDVFSIEAAGLSTGEAVDIPELNLKFRVNEYYKNCTIFTGSKTQGVVVLNASGIGALKGKPTALEAGQNVPGLVFSLDPTPGNTGKVILLYGNDVGPTPLNLAGDRIFFSLRKLKIPLPLTMTLLDFEVKLYPNSNIPKSYSSKVAIRSAGGMERDVVISMNKPLRFEDLTFFQSSYFIDRDGTEYTVLAVVKNPARLMPYVSSLWIFLGMAIHFLVRLFRRKKQRKNQDEQ